MTRTYETEVTIEAPPSDVWKHLTAFDRHAEWSRHFLLDGRPVVGERGRVRFNLFGRQVAYPVVVEKVVEQEELRWRGGPKGFVSGSHFFILESLDGGATTRLRHGETFEGLAVGALWPVLKRQLGPSYGRFNQELKQRVESQRSSTA